MKKPMVWIAIAGLLMLTYSITSHAAEKGSFYPPEIPALKKAEFIFFSNAIFDKPANGAEARKRAEKLEYIMRFKICLTNGYKNFEGKELEDLHAAGCELFLYRWFNGYYEKEMQGNSYASGYPEIVKMLKEIHAHKDWIVNPDKTMQGSGATEPAYFYDFSHPDFRKYYVASIKRDLDEARYDGVFFDYIGSWALPAEVKDLWTKKHPQMTYDEAGIEFLKELRAAIGAKKIFGNQAYRLPEGYYDIIDYDATESHATSFVWGKECTLSLEGKGSQKLTDTFIRNWDGVGGYREISKERRAMVLKKPRVKVCDINYLQPWRVPTGGFAEVGDLRTPAYGERTDRPGIFYSYAVSKLENGAVFASDWYCEGFGQDDVYFLDLGESLNKDYIETPDAVVRYFKNGFVVVTRSASRVHFEPDAQFVPKDASGLWDVYEGTPVRDWAGRKSVTIYPAWYPSTQSYYPSGRVYMYRKNSQ